MRDFGTTMGVLGMAGAMTLLDNLSTMYYNFDIYIGRKLFNLNFA